MSRRFALAAAAGLVAAIAAEVLVGSSDDTAVDLGHVLEGPSGAHLLGTDEVGRDLGARVLEGVRVSLTIAVLAAVAAAVVGTLVGLLAGALGGRVDAAVMRVVDVLSAQNHFLFGILLVVLFRPAIGGAGAIMLAVGLTHWPSLARIVRGELLSVRERPFVLTVPHAIFHESAYSFLGLGLPAHEASLGNILADGQRSLLAGGWWIALFPGLAILLAAMAIGTLAEHWRERLHPRWRSELEL